MRSPSSHDPMSEALQVNDAASERVSHRLCAAICAEFVGDGSHVEFHRAGRDAEPPCDLLVRGAVDQQLEHVALAWRELRLAVRATGRFHQSHVGRRAVRRDRDTWNVSEQRPQMFCEVRLADIDSTLAKVKDLQTKEASPRK